MRIEVDQISKRYDYQWILRDWSCLFEEGSTTGISGRNGSGKSTLIKMLSGYLPPTKGEIHYSQKNIPIASDSLYDKIALVAPYTDLIREFTMQEMWAFHGKVRRYIDDMSYQEFADIVALKKASQQIQYYSSGMNQRLQLALQILSDTPLILLDEPTSFLDSHAKAWTYDLIDRYRGDRTLIISSNESDDLEIADRVITL